MPPCPREYRCGSRSARRDVPARRQQRNRRRRPPSTAMSDQAGVARFHQSRARGSGLRGPTRETREFREQVWPRLAAQTRFARAAGTARSLAATLFVCKHQRWKQKGVGRGSSAWPSDLRIRPDPTVRRSGLSRLLLFSRRRWRGDRNGDQAQVRLRRVLAIDEQAPAHRRRRRALCTATGAVDPRTARNAPCRRGQPEERSRRRLERAGRRRRGGDCDPGAIEVQPAPRYHFGQRPWSGAAEPDAVTHSRTCGSV